MHIIHHHFKTIHSTNTWAKENGEGFDESAITLITADEQTAGRGRFNRRWESPLGQNIYATYCIPFKKHRSDAGNLGQIAAISVVEILRALKFNAYLKWPNDVLIDGKKVSGILSESSISTEKTLIFVGIGLNINMTKSALDAIDRPATSLSVEGGKELNRELILAQLNHVFGSAISLFIERGFGPFLQKYKDFLVLLGQSAIRFDDNRRIWEGVIDSVNDDGSLNVRLLQGSLQTFYAGEVLF